MEAILIGPYSPEAGDEGPRLGGAPPRGVAPQRKENKYLLTVPILGTDEEVSAFLPDFDILNETSGVLDFGDIVEVIRHPRSVRAAPGTAHDSELTGHAMPLLNEFEDNSAEPSSRSKLGGYPYFYREYEKVGAAVERFMSVGGIQILQLDVPGPGVSPKGSWPLGNGLLHILGRPPFSSQDICSFWEI